MFSDEELLTLSRQERAHLAHQLDELTAAETSITPSREALRARHRFLLLVTGACVMLIPWIVLLAVTLPHRYVSNRWSATWVGFDIVLLASLAATAWLGWRRRQAVVLASLASSTLLVADAWFDVMSASTRGDLAMSVATAVLVELPLAALLAETSRRLLGFAARNAPRVESDANTDVSLWKLPLVGVPH